VRSVWLTATCRPPSKRLTIDRDKEGIIGCGNVSCSAGWILEKLILGGHGLSPFQRSDPEFEF
jgi:hypothetical protein